MGSDPRHACVVGAGLAGAAVAAMLVRRGWRITLLDTAERLADGASALPVGMLSPHLTRSPTPMSRLSALGVARTRLELERLVPVGRGWTPVQVDNRGHAPGRHPAALVRPAALVQAWVEEGARSGHLNLRLGAPVARIAPEGGSWRLLSADGAELERAGSVVLAAALGSRALAESAGLALPLHPVQGQLSLGALQGPALAERPQRDDGVFVPEYSDPGLAPRWPERIWAVGSTYRRGATDTASSLEAHRENLERLRPLSPAAAQVMDAALADGSLQAWAGVRCASLDRLPLMGAAPDPAALAGRPPQQPPLAALPRLSGLFLCCAFGSRGLALAALAGEALAASMDGDAMPLPADLRDAVDPARFAWRAARRAPR
jgi:tRNA 5-methylaminomethyl-2-thiouridine biosynthesis bifunctional protein